MNMIIKSTLSTATLLLSMLWSHGVAAGDSELQTGVIDNTLSHKGHAFYQAFTMAWEEYENTLPYLLVVSENRSARGGHRIQVAYKGRAVYQTTLGRAPAYGQLAADASGNVSFQVQQVALQMLASGSPDLSDDEI